MSRLTARAMANAPDSAAQVAGIKDCRAKLYDWPFWALNAQLPPKGDWMIWLMMAGRGFGKTRSGAEWVRMVAEADGAARIALIGATRDEVRN